MVKKLYAALCIIFLLPILVQAQSQRGEIKGVIKDAKTKEKLDFVNVVALLNGFQAGGSTSDINGKYSISALQPGKYTVIAKFVGYSDYVINNVSVRPDQITFLDLELEETTTTLKEVKIRTYKSPIIRADDNGKSLDGDQIKKLPTRNANALANMGSGVFSFDGGTPSFRGARSSGTAYYINGVRVIGSVNLPQNGIGQTNVITGGVSAEYGDFTGGAISFTTPPPSTTRRSGIEIITSSLFDQFHFNQIEAYTTGPLIIRNKGKETERAILGYSIAGNFNYAADPSPSAIGIWKVKDDVLKELEARPLRPSSQGVGFVPSAEFIRESDLEKVSAKLNTPVYNVSMVGDLNFAPSKDINVVLGGTYNYSNVSNYNYRHSLFNFNNNIQTINHSLLSYVTFTQKLVAQRDPNDKTKRLIDKAYYSVSLQYQSNWNLQQDAVHQDRLFDYGYVGSFKNYYRPNYELRANDGPNGSADMYIVDGDTVYLKNYLRQIGFVDTGYGFDRAGTRNPILSNYTSNYYDLVEGEVNSFSQLRGSNSGLVNGQSPIGIYSFMWQNVGSLQTGYNKSQNEQFSLNAVGEASIKGHDLKFGLYYEQRVSRSYNVGANGLWQLMWQLTGRQDNGMRFDLDNPILLTDENGIFQNVVNYNLVVDPATQKNFDKNFRKYLMENGKVDSYGKPIDNTSLIDVNSYDPSDFKMEYFSADELLNQGNSLVSYFGYDYLGNKIRGKQSIESFTNDSINRTVGAYMPIYTAAFIQDKFTFKDLILRVGVRVERFDANQPVLKDPYSLYPIRTAGEVKELNGNPITHPAGVNNDFAVYVNNTQNPTGILGYRNGNFWFNRDGVQIQDPDVIASQTSSGIIQPYLVDPNNQRVTANSFSTYDPQINVLPRIWFDFPINSEARFFANYDVIAQRPSNIFTPINDFYFLQNTPTNIINNPNLKPQITTDYEIGYKQKIGDNSGLSLIANYREQRNLIQQFRFNYAYPISYVSYGNLDFSTIKGFRVEYEIRDLGNFNFDANYTLQYADGTGSGTNSQQALIAAGQPNLRNLFPLNIDIRHNIKFNFFFDYKNGDEYNGPIVKGKKIFQNAGIGLLLNAFSGIPYTVNEVPTPNALAGVATRSPIKGTPFGSRLPWQIQNDIQVYKSYQVQLGKTREGKPKYGMWRFSLWVQNFLNVQNIGAVHPYTGSPDNDGYLNSELGRQYLQGIAEQQAFIELYNVALANPGFYGLPRRTRLTIKLDF
jgi:hypothetical protein